MTADPPSKKCDARNRERQTSLDSFFGLTRQDLRQTIAFLIEHRELLRDDELARLERESRGLAARLKDLDQRKLIAELECFKDVLALHRRLVDNGGPRH